MEINVVQKRFFVLFLAVFLGSSKNVYRRFAEKSSKQALNSKNRSLLLFAASLNAFMVTYCPDRFLVSPGGLRIGSGTGSDRAPDSKTGREDM